MHAQAWSDTVTGEILNDAVGYPNWHGIKQGPAMINWTPEMAMGNYTGQYQAGWSVTGNDDFIVYSGGEFPRVNGTAQQGLVRYGKKPVAPGKQGPILPNGSLTPQIIAVTGTSARITWPTAFDRDNRSLTYTLYRGNTVINTQAADSNWWTLPALGFVDTNVTPAPLTPTGVVVSDGSNVINGASASSAHRTGQRRGGQHLRPVGDQCGCEPVLAAERRSHR